MIISREFVSFKTLVEGKDPAGQLFIELLHKSYPRDMWEKAYQALAKCCLYEREMEWGFRGIGNLIDGFKKLDAENPYDNGFSLDDIWDAEVIENNGNTITLLLKTPKNKEQKIVAVKRIKI